MYTDRFSLAGKVALVTGGTGAMGSHFCKGLAEAGADVIVVSRTAAKQDALVAEIAAAGGSATGIVCDMADGAAVEAMCDEAWDRHAHVDVIVHNATDGSGTGTGVATTTDEQFALADDVIAKSAWTTFRSLCPRMVANGGGSIVSVVSSTGTVPQRNLFPYGMAKGALQLLTRYVAQEWGPEVRANCIVPGTIDTNGTMAAHPLAPTMLPRIAAGRFGGNEECVGAVLFLVSDAASYVSGQVLPIDGGRF